MRRATPEFIHRFLLEIFQSTLSVRRATIRRQRVYSRLRISIHALREESDETIGKQWIHDVISIHALREESDVNAGASLENAVISIHALREESDVFSVDVVGPLVISIHALREESDLAGRTHLFTPEDFNPRSP